jgi:GDSL-like Lipase/Acylhydrolase
MTSVKPTASGKAPSGPQVLLALGDSVIWGQGLLPGDKFCYLVKQALRKNTPNLVVANQAHSGATILYGRGPDSDITAPDYFSAVGSATGEVPRSNPTVLEQCVYYAGDADEVKLILVDGGINDVSIFNIVNPLYTKDKLEQAVEQHCHREMAVLLKCLAAKFNQPDCRILVIGYFPILSRASDIRMIPQLLFALRVSPLSAKLWPNNPITLALDFWHKSDTALERAVSETNDHRICFVASGFSEENALFTGTGALLREPHFDQSHIEDPVDDKVYSARKAQCEIYPQDVPSSLTCPVASIGHPTEAGAKAYRDAILGVL